MTYGRFGEPKELERERAVLANMSDGWGPFLMSSNLQLIPIRQLELFRNKTQLQNDAAMAEGEKQQKIAEIDQQLDALATLASIVEPATQ
jgi:phosphonate transport system substrate-binding protein